MLYGGLLLLILAAGCTFQKPAQPDWDVNLEVPLIGKRYTMTELAKDVNELLMDAENDEVIVRFDQDFETFEIGDQTEDRRRLQDGLHPGQRNPLSDSVEIPAEVVVVGHRGHQERRGGHRPQQSRRHGREYPALLCRTSKAPGGRASAA